MSDWAERMTQIMRKQGAALNGPQIQLATMTGNNTLTIGQMVLDADDLIFSAHLLDSSDMPVLKAGDTVAVLQMSDSRFWVLDKVGGGMIYNGLDQTTAGTMLDATQGAALDARIDEVAETASTANETANTVSDALASKQDAIAEESFSGKTSGYGILQITTGTTKLPVYVVSDGYICLPFISGRHTFIKVLNRTSMAAVTGTTISGTAYYLT